MAKKRTKQELSNGRQPTKNPYIDTMDSGGRPIKLISEQGMIFIEKMASIMKLFHCFSYCFSTKLC